MDPETEDGRRGGKEDDMIIGKYRELLTLRESTSGQRSLAKTRNPEGNKNQTQLLSIVCSRLRSLLYLFSSMRFNCLWFLPCWCLSELIQKHARVWKGEKEERGWEKEKEKTEECVWLMQVCCSWQTVWEPRSHCVPCPRVTVAPNGGH